MVIRVHTGIGQVPAAAWDALVGPDGSPFLEHRWLLALEESGCAVADTGWYPSHITVWDEDERLWAAAPVYLKVHSMGEFVYDWSWANAARQLGVDYYPKIVVGVPFTPATGQRLLVAPGADAARARQILVSALHQLAKQAGCAGIHVLFNPVDCADSLGTLGAATRLQFQFHWENQGFSSFDDFLGQFRSKRRSEFKRERRKVAADGVRVVRVSGDQATDAQIAAMHRFYQITCDQFGGRTYLNPAFWGQVRDRFGDRVQLVLAYDGDRAIAGAFNVEKGKRLYGRYWGCSEERRFLHFEVCYYQAIEHCIERGLDVFEPGHGGGHKYPRGFLPTLTHSSHWILEPRLNGPIRDFVEREAAEVRLRAAALRERSDLG